jgi:hypothetical protein
MKKTELIWQKFVELGTKSLHYKRKAQELIPKLATSKIYLKHGFSTLEHAASEIAGISPETTRKILSTYKRTEKLPNLRKAMNKVGYSKVATVLRVQNKLQEKELVEMVEDLPTKTLRVKVNEIKNPDQKGQPSLFSEHSSENSGSGSQATPRFSSELSQELQENLNLIKHKLEQEKGHPITNQELLEYFVSKENLPEKVQAEYPRKNKTLTPKHKEQVKAQNRNICQSKNCSKVATEIHHQNYQSLDPRPTNLKAYCKIHHQLAHYETQNKSPEQLKVDQRVRAYWLKQ